MSSNPNLKQVLKMSARTWTRDSHGLFDYETTGYTYSTLFLENSNQLFRKKLNGKIDNNENENPDINDELLLTVNKTNDNAYFITNNLPEKPEYPSITTIKDLTQKAWYVLNSDQDKKQEDEDYYLNLYDIIKLGRVKYVVTEYKVKQLPFQEKKENSYNISYDNFTRGSLFNLVYQTERFEESRGQHDKLCKICYMSDNEHENPLVSLCGCIGGIRFVHFQCLKTWMQTKLTFKENINRNAKSYMLKGFNCEICQKAYPFKFKFKDELKEYSLVDIKIPFQGEYIVLESLNQMKDKVNTKIIHVINLNQEQHIIGRGHECDVRINDISVSRAHSYLTFNKVTKKITIRDLKSKFGTLVLIKFPLMITSKAIKLQVGRTVFCSQMVPKTKAETGGVLVGYKFESKKTTDIDESHDILMNDNANVNEKETETVIDNKDSHLNNSVNGDDLSN